MEAQSIFFFKISGILSGQTSDYPKYHEFRPAKLLITRNIRSFVRPNFWLPEIPLFSQPNPCLPPQPTTPTQLIQHSSKIPIFLNTLVYFRCGVSPGPDVLQHRVSRKCVTEGESVPFPPGVIGGGGGVLEGNCIYFQWSKNTVKLNLILTILGWGEGREGCWTTPGSKTYTDDHATSGKKHIGLSQGLIFFTI